MTASQTYLVLSALMGLSGVALLASGAHVGGGSGASGIQTAGQFLLFHAPVVMAVTALRNQGLMWNGAASLSLAVLIFGLALFCGDLALRGFQERRLFAYAAPIGGSLVMLGWLGLAVAALIRKGP